MQRELNRKELAVALDGKLLSREELPIGQALLPILLEENLLKTKPALTSSLFITQCTRCGNKHSDYFAKIHCQKCGKTHPYCRNCIDMGRMMACEVLYYWNGPSPEWPRHSEPCSWEGTLTVAQELAATRITQAIIKTEAEILIWAVCGAGKTEMLFPGITKALETGKRICLATPRKDVVKELKPRLEQAFQNVPIQALYGGSNERENDAQLILATTHQLLRYQHAFDVMIIDEVDAFPFHADKTLPFAQKRAEKPECTTIYLTATPRQDFKKKINQKKLPHVFVPIRYHGHPLPIPKLKMCYSLQKELPKNEIPRPFLDWLMNRKKKERQLLVFVPTIDLAEQLTKTMYPHLKNLEIIQDSSELSSVHASDRYREKKVLDFREKKIKVLLTTTILERGVTFPSIDVAILDAGHDVFDEAALVQIAGRAGRNAKDPTGEVVFFHDGKTEAMLEAIYEIKQMNKRGGF